jgi:hypothetical protein
VDLVKKFFSRLNQIFLVLCCIAFFINIGLLLFAGLNNMFDLKILSILNMLLLSFVLLRDNKE